MKFVEKAKPFPAMQSIACILLAKYEFTLQGKLVFCFTKHLQHFVLQGKREAFSTIVVIIT